MERTSMLYKLRRCGQVAASKVLSKELLSKIYYRIVLKKTLHLSNPKAFNEKIQWLKLYHYPNEPLIVQCSDKYAVRKYVAEKGLGEKLVPLAGAWEKAEDIDWDSLPDRFVLKCNHGCAYNILCSDKSKLDRQSTARQLNKWMREDFGAYNIELHYSRIHPHMITCEEYLGECITDYKFFCFNGEPKYIYVSTGLIRDRDAKMGFFHLDGSRIPLQRDDYDDIGDMKLIPCFDQMLEDARTLCADFPFVRVDFFLANDTYYFAELTFTPGAGMMPFNPDSFDQKWGSMLDISGLQKKHQEIRALSTRR